jgi:hypothetical protein
VGGGEREREREREEGREGEQVRERGESSLHYSLPVFGGRWKRQAPKLRDNLELRERSSYQTRSWCERERGKEGGESQTGRDRERYFGL